MQTTLSTIQRGSRIGKLIEQNGSYSVRLFLNNGETLVSRHLGKSWKNPKTATEKILEFISS